MTTYRQLSSTKYAWKPFQVSRFDGLCNNIWPSRGYYFLKALDVKYEAILKMNIKSKYENDII